MHVGPCGRLHIRESLDQRNLEDKSDKTLLWCVFPELSWGLVIGDIDRRSGLDSASTAAPSDPTGVLITQRQRRHK